MSDADAYETVMVHVRRGTDPPLDVVTDAYVQQEMRRRRLSAQAAALAGAPARDEVAEARLARLRSEVEESERRVVFLLRQRDRLRAPSESDREAVSKRMREIRIQDAVERPDAEIGGRPR